MPVFRHYFSSSKLWCSLDFWLTVRHRLVNIGWIFFFSKKISLSEDLIWSFLSFKEIEQHFRFQIKEDVEESVQPCLRSWAAKIVSENRPAKIVSSTSYSMITKMYDQQSFNICDQLLTFVDVKSFGILLTSQRYLEFQTSGPLLNVLIDSSNFIAIRISCCLFSFFW